MNKTLSKREVEQLSTAAVLSIPGASVIMSRQERLFRFAKVVSKHEGPIYIYHRLEFVPPDDYRKLPKHPHSPFGIAYADPILKAAGLEGPGVDHAAKFFELNPVDLHSFSCDCGGAISGTEMAARIEHVAIAPRRVSAFQQGIQFLRGQRRRV
jgi:hypothetical protein